MNFKIRPYHPDDCPDLLQLSVRAWEPVFTAWERILGSDLYPIAIYPDWRKSQAEAVEKALQDERMTTWVGEVDGKAAGFIVYEMNADTKVGEVQLLAVDPDDQNQGLGTELNLFVLQKFRESGMKLAVVGTGGDEGHAPARRSYEKAGYTGLPLVRYYQAL